MCFYMTKSLTLTCCAPLILMGARYYYSRKVIQNYLDCALHTDMADIDAYYMKPTGKRQGTHHCFHKQTHTDTQNVCSFVSSQCSTITSMQLVGEKMHWRTEKFGPVTFNKTKNPKMLFLNTAVFKSLQAMQRQIIKYAGRLPAFSPLLPYLCLHSFPHSASSLGSAWTLR